MVLQLQWICYFYTRMKFRCQCAKNIQIEWDIIIRKKCWILNNFRFEWNGNLDYSNIYGKCYQILIRKKFSSKYKFKSRMSQFQPENKCLIGITLDLDFLNDINLLRKYTMNLVRTGVISSEKYKLHWNGIDFSFSKWYQQFRLEIIRFLLENN